VLDFRGEAGMLGKNTGDDLREGKMTLPIISALATASPSERELILAALGNATTGATETAAVIAVLDRHGALDRTLEQANTHARRAREALKSLPPSEMKALLGDVAEFTVMRAY
jgi:octaprenyl-diphosphate synthase